jgi:hypothetical protein
MTHRKHNRKNVDGLKAATGQPTQIAAAYEAGRLCRCAGATIHDVYPIGWPQRLRIAFGDGFAGGLPVHSWKAPTIGGEA